MIPISGRYWEFFSSLCPDWLWGPPSLLSSGYWGLFLPLGVKGPGHEADHSYLVLRSRMHEVIPPLPQYVFMAWCLVKHRDNFTFYKIYRMKTYCILKKMLE
jgi:hypothetical protein